MINNLRDGMGYPLCDIIGDGMGDGRGYGNGYGEGGNITTRSGLGWGFMYGVSTFNDGKGIGRSVPNILLCVDVTDLLCVAVNTLVRFK